jgi:ParB family transcriptional regulator, chromosome partitioning protein
MLARRLGKSRTAITESLSLQAMPDDVKNLCRLADIASKSLLLQVVRQSDPQKMVALVEKISAGGGATRQDVRKATAKPKPGRPKAFRFNYKPQHKNFTLTMSFRKGSVEREEVITALEGILADLRNQN